MTNAIIILILMNLFRETPLQVDVQLQQNACERAEFLVENKQWSHKGYEAYVSKEGYTFVGENLARKFDEDEIVPMFVAWLKSASHKSNIVNPRFTHAGVCRYGNITVVLFGGEKK